MMKRNGNNMIFLGLDAGSTGIKCVAFSEEGVQLSVAYSEYKTAAGAGDMSADAIFSAASDVIKGCVSSPAVDRGDVAAIAVTSFGEACVPVDRDGRCLCDMVMYTDRRGVEENDAIVKKLGKDRISAITCASPAPMYSLPKIVWALGNVPGVRENAYKFLQAADFICFRLSGEFTSTHTQACRTEAFDLEKREFSHEILAAAGVDPSLMPEPVPNGTVIGTLRPALAEEFGLPSSVRVVAGSQDQIAAATGAGVLSAGQAVDGTGSVECITPVFDHIIRDSSFTGDNFACVPHSVSGLYATYAFNFSGGVLLKWFRDTFASSVKAEAKSRGVSAYRILDETCPAEPSDILVVPHFLGAGGTPDIEPDAKGSIMGMTMQTGLPDIYRAVMEGLTYEMVYNLEKLAAQGICINELMATGGGASSPVWLQLKADIFGSLCGIRSITPLLTDEAGAAGCAMMAGVAVGRFDSLAQAAESFVKYGDTVYPDLAHKALYAEKYSRYKLLRAATLEAFTK